VDLIDERLSLHGAIFRDEKTNARVTSPTDPTQNILGGDQQVDGSASTPAAGSPTGGRSSPATCTWTTR